MHLKGIVKNRCSFVGYVGSRQRSTDNGQQNRNENLIELKVES